MVRVTELSALPELKLTVTETVFIPEIGESSTTVQPLLKWRSIGFPGSVCEPAVRVASEYSDQEAFDLLLREIRRNRDVARARGRHVAVR